MKFSVLLSLYAREQPEFLRACLHSLAAQTRAADDIVLVFDGTLPENLENVVHEFQPILPINIVRLPENVGLGRALNVGLSHCRHEWVFRMDTDDIALPERFALQCAFIQKQPKVQLLGGQIREFIHHPAHSHASRRVPTEWTQIKAFAKQRNPFNHMTVAYTQSAVARAGGYRHHLYMEDYHLWLRMLALDIQAANLPDTLVAVRTGAGMLARRRGRLYIRSEWQLMLLKRQLHTQNTLSALYSFALRATPRLLPETWLHHIYRLLR